MKELGYTEPEANARVTASRLLGQVPEIEAKIESGALSLTQLVKASAFFTKEKQTAKPLTREEKATVLAEIENKSVAESERVFFAISANPEALITLKERTRIASSTHTVLLSYMSDEEKKVFERVKEIWAYRLPNPSWMELFVEMAKEIIKHHDPNEKAMRAHARKLRKERQPTQPFGQRMRNDQNVQTALADQNDSKKREGQNERIERQRSEMNRRETGLSEKQQSELSAQFERTRLSEPIACGESLRSASRSSERNSVGVVKCHRRKVRPAIRAEVKHVVRARDLDQCTFVDDEGIRCASRHGLECDHVVPFALGGEATPENLRMRCRAHNLRAAIEIFGQAKMTRFLSVT